MPLGTLDRNAPPLFNQGPSALTKLAVFSALALFLMVADVRFRITTPLRAVVATVLFPLQWLAMRPVVALQEAAHYFSSVQSAKSAEEDARRRVALQAQRAQQSEQLALENARLRKLLDLRDAQAPTARAAEVLYEAADPYTRRVIIDKGQVHGIGNASPVIDERGVVGQVTRVYPLTSEVSLLIDRDYTVPVLNTRTGARSVAYGDPQFAGGSLELRWLGGNVDVKQDDVLTTSGVDGVYPPGLAVGRVSTVERRADSAFARIHATPAAIVAGTKHVLVLQTQLSGIPPRPEPDVAAPSKKGGRK
jgi:rod shape-determining protein MreC